jgi:hypothetical protein
MMRHVFEKIACPINDCMGRSSIPSRTRYVFINLSTANNNSLDLQFSRSRSTARSAARLSYLYPAVIGSRSAHANVQS